MSLEKLRDLVVYELSDDGEEIEIEIENEDDISSVLSSEVVLVFCRFDLRRIFIWKGPRSPVRKRFISSRVATRIQQMYANQRGMHMKIISVDAGDEPVEFLSSFKIQSYEIDEDDKLEDLYYKTNEQRRKEEEAKYAKPKKESEEYFSPLLEEAKKNGKATPKQQLAKVRNAEQEYNIRKMPIAEQRVMTGGFAVKEVEAILESVKTKEVPEGLKRLNIIIGNQLYGASIVKQNILGKEIEKEKWLKIEEIPEKIIEIPCNSIRVHSNGNSVSALEIFQSVDANKLKPAISQPEDVDVEVVKKKTSKEKANRRDNLPEIPKA